MKKKNKAGTFFTPVVAVTGIFLAVIGIFTPYYGVGIRCMA